MYLQGLSTILYVEESIVKIAGRKMRVLNNNNPYLKQFITIFVMSNIYLSNHNKVYAFSKLKNGFEEIASSYLVPLAYAVAGASLMYYLIMSLMNQQENLRKAATVFGVTICVAVGPDILKTIQSVFS